MSDDDIGRVRERCRALVRKKAAISAGISAVPIPGVDMVADLTSFASMVEAINKDFGLTPAQIEAMQPHMRVVTYQAMAALGSTLVGKLVTKELVLKLLQKSGPSWRPSRPPGSCRWRGRSRRRRSASRCSARWATSTWKPAPGWRRRWARTRRCKVNEPL
jgi:hypothetical protein